jgi:hypothetical protein
VHGAIPRPGAETFPLVVNVYRQQNEKHSESHDGHDGLHVADLSNPDFQNFDIPYIGSQVLDDSSEKEELASNRFVRADLGLD